MSAIAKILSVPGIHEYLVTGAHYLVSKILKLLLSIPLPSNGGCESWPIKTLNKLTFFFSSIFLLHNLSATCAICSS